MSPVIHKGAVRVTATLSRHLYDRLMDRSDNEGRSLSNLTAYLLESSMADYGGFPSRSTK